MKYPRDWEEIHYEKGESIKRLRVPGGWLVLYSEFGGESMSGDTWCEKYMAFIPDLYFQWELEDEK